MSKLLNSTFFVTETTALGTTRPDSQGVGSDAGFTVQKIQVAGASSVAANTSGGVEFRYGSSSGAAGSSMVILPSPTSVGLVVELCDLNIKCSWFEVESNEAGQYAVWVWGN